MSIRFGVDGVTFEYKARFPVIHCKSGVRLSVQTGDSLYCTPRDNDGPYTEVEVGFVTNADNTPTRMPETWWEYADGEVKDGVSDVWGYVPVELVEAFIASQGGIDIGRTVNMPWTNGRN